MPAPGVERDARHARSARLEEIGVFQALGRRRAARGEQAEQFRFSAGERWGISLGISQRMRGQAFAAHVPLVKGERSALAEAAARLLGRLDHFNLLPAFFIQDDPLYISVFVANLGSLKMGAAYHHLYEYGNCPLFLVLGQVEDRPGVVEGRVEVQTAKDHPPTDPVASNVHHAPMEIRRRRRRHASPGPCVEAAGERLLDDLLCLGSVVDQRLRGRSQLLI